MTSPLVIPSSGYISLLELVNSSSSTAGGIGVPFRDKPVGGCRAGAASSRFLISSQLSLPPFLVLMRTSAKEPRSLLP